MIFGVAQLVVNVAEIEDAAANLERSGYVATFAERGLPNQPEKESFQGASRRALDLLHFKSPDGGVAIELTAYDGPPAGAPSYRLEPSGVALAASDASGAFWTDGLGFRRSGDRLRFPAAFPAWRLDLDLETGDPGSGTPRTVDADGCVLVTMLVTDVEREVERLARIATVRPSGVWQERVAGRDLRVAVVAGPSGELVELLEIVGGT